MTEQRFPTNAVFRKRGKWCTVTPGTTGRIANLLWTVTPGTTGRIANLLWSRFTSQLFVQEVQHTSIFLTSEYVSPRALLQSKFASRHIDLFWKVWQPVLIVNNWEVKRHVVGKKCIRHYAADRVFASFRDASALLCLQLHQNTLWRVETQSSTGVNMNQNASSSGCWQVWDMTVLQQSMQLSSCQRIVHCKKSWVDLT